MDLAYNDSFIGVVKYIYTGKLIMEKEGIYRIFDVLFISKTLELTNLLEEVSLLLTKSLTLENVALIKEKAIKHNIMQISAECDDREALMYSF